METNELLNEDDDYHHNLHSNGDDMYNDTTNNNSNNDTTNINRNNASDDDDDEDVLGIHDDSDNDSHSSDDNVDSIVFQGRPMSAASRRPSAPLSHVMVQETAVQDCWEFLVRSHGHSNGTKHEPISQEDMAWIAPPIYRTETNAATESLVEAEAHHPRIEWNPSVNDVHTWEPERLALPLWAFSDQLASSSPPSFPAAPES
jgi:hypothetical protein